MHTGCRVPSLVPLRICDSSGFSWNLLRKTSATCALMCSFWLEWDKWNGSKWGQRARNWWDGTNDKKDTIPLPLKLSGLVDEIMGLTLGSLNGDIKKYGSFHKDHTAFTWQRIGWLALQHELFYLEPSSHILTAVIHGLDICTNAVQLLEKKGELSRTKN